MFFGFVTKHTCARQTDGQTDRRTDGQNYDPKTALAYLLHVVKWLKMFTAVVRLKTVYVFTKSCLTLWS